jgi:hypothetical protein
MRKKTIAIVSLAVIAGMCWVLTVFSSAVFIGCKTLTWAVKSMRPVLIQSDNLESEPGVRVLDANNPFFKVARRGPKRIGIEWAETNMNLEYPKCKVKQLAGMRVRITGKLNNKGYPVVIDSGNPMALVVPDTVVTDCGLEIYPMEELGPPFGGLCHVARIEIGNMAITNPMCHYMLSHYERRVLGRTIWKQRDIILGLGLIRKFVYVLIDNITGEVEFCMEGSFEADPNESWSQYSMSIETDDQNQERLLVDMPIAGQARKVVFDTGSDCGLVTTEKIWEEFSDNLTVLRSRDSRLGTPGGIVACRKITVEKLQVADASINNAIIHVKSNDTPFARGSFTLGMGYFQDAVIVLDFGRELMWIKNPQSP